MRNVLTSVGLRLVGVFAIGLILVVPSELWFYPVDLKPDLAIIVLAYGLSGWLMIALLFAFARSGPKGWWIAAGVFGIVTEGVVVGQMYEVPLFSVLWTPLAWHALITVHLCFVWLARFRRAGQVILVSSLIGLFIGLWGAWMWNVIEAADGTQSFDWTPIPAFAQQVLVGWGLWSCGHLIWSAIAERLRHLNWRRDLWAMLIVAGGLWAMTWSWMAFPLSLTFPLLLVLSVVALRRMPQGCSPLPRLAPKMIVATTALPVAAICAYAIAAAVPLQWPFNVVTILVAGPVALWYWGYAVVASLMRRSDTVET